MFVTGIRAQAQQEVDPTNYPLIPAVARASQRPTPRHPQQDSAHHIQHSIARRAQKPPAGGAHHGAAKIVTVAKSR